MSERDLNDMGVRNGAHRARMISSLVMLREKLNRTFRGIKCISKLFGCTEAVSRCGLVELCTCRRRCCRVFVLGVMKQSPPLEHARPLR